MTVLSRLFRPDPMLQRQLVFLLLAAVVVGTLFIRGAPPMNVNRESQALFDQIEQLQPGDPIIISMDYDPSSRAELHPAARAILRHAFRKRLRVITLGLWQTGKGQANEVIEEEARAARARFPEQPDAYPVYGRDYVYLGWQPGTFALIVRLTEGIQGTFATENRGAPTAGLPIWTGSRGEVVRTLGDVRIVITISAGNPGIDEWIRYGRGKQNIKIGTAVTGVSAPGRMPFFASGQIVGLLAGMRGAAEYEFLMNNSEAEKAGDYGVPPPPLAEALQGMNSLSASHFLIILLVVISNVRYLWSRRRERA